MKRVIRILSLIILIVAVASIVWFTVYTLNHDAIKKVVETNKTKTIEKVTTNMKSDSLSEIYNVYLNKSRHKIKFEYSMKTYENELSDVNLVVYFDGKSVINEKIVSGSTFVDMETLFNDEVLSEFVRLSENNMKILKNDNLDYLLFDIGYYINSGIKEEYFAFNEEAEKILNEGILVKDTTIKYVAEDEGILDFFYNDDDQIYAKIDGNNIYALVPVEVKKKISFNEYKYSFVNGKYEEELINSYTGIKILENTSED